MERKKSLLIKREVAKVGMSVSLALTVGSAFFLKTKKGKQIHLGSGLALAGFSLWHHLLYSKKEEKDKEESQGTLSSPPRGEKKNFTTIEANA